MHFGMHRQVANILKIGFGSWQTLKQQNKKCLLLPEKPLESLAHLGQVLVLVLIEQIKKSKESVPVLKK